MTTRLIAGCLGVLALLAAPAAAWAQAAPPPTLPQPSPPPPPSVETAVPAPPPNAVALCGDGSFVQAPALPASCETRGGLRLILPVQPSAPPPRPAAALSTPALIAPAAATNQPPAGATMRCKDGSWLSGAPAAERCAERGGVATILPPERVPPR